MAMRLSSLLLAMSCVAIGFGAPWIVEALTFTLTDTTGLPAARVSASLLSVHGAFLTIAVVSLVLLAVLALLASLRHQLLARRSVEEHVTWDCGYARPTARMQYTADESVPCFAPHAFPLHNNAGLVSTLRLSSYGNGGPRAHPLISPHFCQYWARSGFMAVGATWASTPVRVVYCAYPSRPAGVEVRLIRC